MVCFENGTYTGVRRRAPHHGMRFLPEAMLLPNWGVLSAALCTLKYINQITSLVGSVGLLSCYMRQVYSQLTYRNET